MKTIPEMNKFELTAFVQSTLDQAGIHVVLSGGTAVSFYTENRYSSYDIDLVNQFSVQHKCIQEALNKMGFLETGRYFTYPGTEFFIEFPPGPVTVGVEPVQKIETVKFSTGILRIISVTDSVKDRLAAFYHWGDEQCLYQATLLRNSSTVDMEEIERWSKKEGKELEFKIFQNNKIY